MRRNQNQTRRRGDARLRLNSFRINRDGISRSQKGKLVCPLLLLLDHSLTRPPCLGIMKKAYELSTLTGTQVLLLVVSETGLVYTFTTAKLQPLVTQPQGKNLIQPCLNSPHGTLPNTSPVDPPPAAAHARPPSSPPRPTTATPPQTAPRPARARP